MQIAFLRGINVGGHNVKKDVLCQVFRDLDLTDVATFIASGNVIFTGGGRAAADRDQPHPADAAIDADLEARLAAALEETLGWPVPTFVRSPGEVAAVVDFADTGADVRPGHGETLQVGFLHRPPTPAAIAQIMALSTPADLLCVDDRQIYWVRRGPVHTSKVTSARLDRAAGGPTTFRNITTMRRLLEVVGR